MIALNVIVYSTQDIAGKNIVSKLRDKVNFKSYSDEWGGLAIASPPICGKTVTLIAVKSMITDFNIPPEIKNVDSIICASRHASESGIPALTTHTPGNFSSADFGGEAEKLAVSNPFGLKAALKKMNELNKAYNIGYRVSYEVTHHGPTLPYTIQFVEIGGSYKQWVDTKAAEIAAEPIIGILSEDKRLGEVAVGVGGGHYAPSFTRIGLETGMNIGHIIPKYKLNSLKKDVFLQTINSNLADCRTVVIDWKGVPASPRAKIKEWSKEYGLELIKTSDLLDKTAG